MPDAPVTPYTSDLAGREPVEAIRDTIARMQKLVDGWPAERFERSYAPGKWSARQILIHLAQCEVMFGTRVRMALATPAYVAQDMDQDAWMRRDTTLSGPDAADAYAAVARMNAMLFAALSPAERATELRHPEYGALTVNWIIHQTAGHQIHHLKQLEKVNLVI
jgi:hypothetical protein